MGFGAGWLLGGLFRANGSPGVVPVERAGGRGGRHFIFIFLGVRFGALGLYGANNTGIWAHFAVILAARPA